jgi:hypothetical protein
MSSNLFAKTKSPDTVIVARVWNSDNIKISLIRGASLFAWQWEITGLYFNCITKFFLGLDISVWSLDSKGIYIVKSLYLFFMDNIISNKDFLHLWELHIPLKIKCLFDYLVNTRCWQGTIYFGGAGGVIYLVLFVI